MLTTKEPDKPLLRAVLVEDDPPLRDLLGRVLEKTGYQVSSFGTIGEGKAALTQKAGAIDLLVSDLRLPDGEGTTLIEVARQVDPRTAIIAITAFGSIDLAVRAVRLGAYEFLTKPIEPAALRLAVERAVEARTLKGEIARLRAALNTETPLLVGRSQTLLDISALIDRLSDSEVTVLITGESGSGKEMVARALHEKSKRRDQPFVAVNVAAIPDNLLESELFGHVRGAFTDARADKQGLFQAASSGTLFLDEIGDMSLPLQAKLLRVLQEREVRPLGSTRSMPLDVRILAATHQDPKKAIAAGRFRADLYYRLAVVEIAIPPLRDRREDIMPLAEHFLHRAIFRTQRPLRGFAAAAAARLLGYGWPGNVRELENVVERAVALCRNEWISVEDLPQALEESTVPETFASAAERMMTLEELERGYVRHVLGRFGGNKKRAADALGISRRTIQRWIGEETQEDPEQNPDKGG